MTTLREQMPMTANRIDRMREQLGVAQANEIIRKAMAGESGYFFAMENHRTFGTPDTSTISLCWWDAADRMHREEPRWMIEAAEFANSIGIEVVIRDLQDVEEARERAKKLRKILREAKHA